MVSSEISVTKEALMFGDGADGADESGGEESEDNAGPVYSLVIFFNSFLPFHFAAAISLEFSLIRNKRTLGCFAQFTLDCWVTSMRMSSRIIPVLTSPIRFLSLACLQLVSATSSNTLKYANGDAFHQKERF